MDFIKSINSLEKMIFCDEKARFLIYQDLCIIKNDFHDKERAYS